MLLRVSPASYAAVIVHNSTRRSAAITTLLFTTLYLGGCGKLFGKKETADAEATPITTASATTTTDTPPTDAPTASAAPTPATAAARKLAHGRKASGDCLDGFLPLVQPPGKATDPCFKACTKNAECTGGEVCRAEQAFSGKRMVCASPVKSKCKPSEIPAGPKEACVKQCVTSSDCAAKQQCLQVSFTDPEAGQVNTHACLAADSAPAASVTPSATVTPSASASASATAAAATFKVGDKITVEWKGSNYPATVTAVAGPNQYKIHYDGYGAEWDEVVGPSRIRGKR